MKTQYFQPLWETLMGRIFPALVLSVAAVALSRAQSSDPVLAKIRSEGLERPQVAPVFEYLTTNIGPRLTASSTRISRRGRSDAAGRSRRSRWK
jgi:hypothetical protein